jgi:hypothetical protein
MEVMYERNFARNLARVKNHPGVSLLIDILGWFFGGSIADCILFFLGFVYPVIDGNGPFCVLLYLIGQFQAWHLSLPKYVMKGRRTDAEFLCYAALFLVITLHPFCELIHVTLLFYFIFWTKIRYSDTFVSISSKEVENNIFLVWKEKVLTIIANCVTM